MEFILKGINSKKVTKNKKSRKNHVPAKKNDPNKKKSPYKKVIFKPLQTASANYEVIYLIRDVPCCQ